MTQKDLSSKDATAAPAGFEQVTVGGSYIATNGPFSVRRDPHGVSVGIRIEQRHCNSAGHCHGGMLATFADVLLTLTLHNVPPISSARRFTPTVSLQLDYLAAVRLGDWLEGRAEVLRVTRSLAFVQGQLYVDGERVLRASGVFKLGRVMDPDSPGLYTGESPVAKL